jgi:hypothetical protein
MIFIIRKLMSNQVHLSASRHLLDALRGLKHAVFCDVFRDVSCDVFRRVLLDVFGVMSRLNSKEKDPTNFSISYLSATILE